MKSMRSSLPVLRPAGLRGSMFMRDLVAGLFKAPEAFTMAEPLRPSEDVELLPLRLTKGCTFFSCVFEGPVERMKSAKSRIDSCSTRGSLARGRVTTFLLGEDLCGTATGPLLLEVDLLGRLLVPKELSLSALTRG